MIEIGHNAWLTICGLKSLADFYVTEGGRHLLDPCNTNGMDLGLHITIPVVESISLSLQSTISRYIVDRSNEETSICLSTTNRQTDLAISHYVNNALWRCRFISNNNSTETRYGTGSNLASEKQKWNDRNKWTESYGWFQLFGNSHIVQRTSKKVNMEITFREREK